MADIDNTADILDVRDLIAAFEAFETQIEDADPDGDSDMDDEDKASFAALKTLLEELKDSGGDEQWRGAWYPLTLIAVDHFEDYAQELAQDIGAVKADAPWPTCHIDWKAAAEALQNDYCTVDYDGATFWYR